MQRPVLACGRGIEPVVLVLVCVFVSTATWMEVGECAAGIWVVLEVQGRNLRCLGGLQSLGSALSLQNL